MIHVVFCKDATEKADAVDRFKDLTVQVFGSSNIVRAYRYVGDTLTTCGVEVGPGAFLVVAQG